MALPNEMFVAQTTLEIWVDTGDADWAGHSLTILSEKATYDLEPAVRIISIVEGNPSVPVMDKVIKESRIHELGGEMLGDSVMLGDDAYEVRAGYIARRS